jgi:hypothetical protein
MLGLDRDSQENVIEALYARQQTNGDNSDESA